MRISTGLQLGGRRCAYVVRAPTCWPGSTACASTRTASCPCHSPRSGGRRYCPHCRSRHCCCCCGYYCCRPGADLRLLLSLPLLLPLLLLLPLSLSLPLLLPLLLPRSAPPYPGTPASCSAPFPRRQRTLARSPAARMHSSAAALWLALKARPAHGRSPLARGSPGPGRCPCRRRSTSTASRCDDGMVVHGAVHARALPCRTSGCSGKFSLRCCSMKRLRALLTGSRSIATILMPGLSILSTWRGGQQGVRAGKGNGRWMAGAALLCLVNEEEKLPELGGGAAVARDFQQGQVGGMEPFPVRVPWAASAVHWLCVRRECTGLRRAVVRRTRVRQTTVRTG